MKYLVTDDLSHEPTEVVALSARAAVTLLSQQASWATLASRLYARTESSGEWECFGWNDDDGWRFCGAVPVRKPAPPVTIPAADARRYAEAVRLAIDPHASVAQREHAAVTVRELLRVLSRVV